MNLIRRAPAGRFKVVKMATFATMSTADITIDGEISKGGFIKEGFAMDFADF